MLSQLRPDPDLERRQLLPGAGVTLANHRNDVHLSKYVLVDCNYVKVLHLCDVLIHEATLISQDG